MSEQFKIIAVGGSEFTLGFRLSGLETLEVLESSNSKETISKLIENKEAGIVIVDEKTMDSLPDQFREDIEAMVRPVVVTLSTTSGAQETLRKKIMKSIGVDLWSK
ncbi:hypothetical protein J4434_05565 [Candidatus Woesearchaeota archaeon]|nr:hypothetical protein [Candidatus Woesearchaeota archaeon]